MAEKKLFATKEEIESAYLNLGSAEKVALHFNVSKKTILNHMKKFNLARKERDTSTHAVSISVLSKRGFSASEIGGILGLNGNHVSRIARLFGIRIPDYFHKGYAKTDSGYILVMRPDHPHADCKGYVREHRLVVEKRLGTILDKSILVHHADERKSNNDDENLDCMTIGQHVSHHHTGKDGRKRKDIMAKEQCPALVPVSP